MSRDEQFRYLRWIAQYRRVAQNATGLRREVAFDAARHHIGVLRSFGQGRRLP